MGSSTYKKRKLKKVTVLVLGKGAFERHKCDIRTSRGKRYHFDLMLGLEENMTFDDLTSLQEVYWTTRRLDDG